MRFSFSARRPPRFPKLRSERQPQQPSIPDMIQRIVYTPEELLVSVSNTLKIHDYETGGHHGWLERFLGLYKGAGKADRITIDSMRLVQLFELAGIGDPPDDVSISGTYTIDAAALRKALKLARKMAAR